MNITSAERTFFSLHISHLHNLVLVELDSQLRHIEPSEWTSSLVESITHSILATTAPEYALHTTYFVHTLHTIAFAMYGLPAWDTLINDAQSAITIHNQSVAYAFAQIDVIEVDLTEADRAAADAIARANRSTHLCGND